MRNMEKFVMQIAHDILCASSESGSHVEQVMPEGIINGFADFDESYDSDTLQNVVDWLFKEAVETVGDKFCEALVMTIENKVDDEYLKAITKRDNEIDYLKSVIQSLLDNSDEYARQRAMDAIKEKEV